ncbi:hypothetical protein EDB80DRAFT_175491 [Ilyonectria destructans]|nr:hypothetical protein EDB80DRAFT_175491 [Ilyonectria destructans]
MRRCDASQTGHHGAAAQCRSTYEDSTCWSQVSHDRLCFNSPTSQIGDLSRSSMASSTNRGPPTPNGNRVGNVLAKNEVSNESANSSPRETWMYGSQPSPCPCTPSAEEPTHVLGTALPSPAPSPPTASQAKRNFSTSSTSGGPSSANMPEEVTSLIAFAGMIGHNVTSTRDLVFFVSPGSLSLAARRVLSLVEQSHDLLDLYRALVVHGPLHGRHNYAVRVFSHADGSFRSMRSYTNDGTPCSGAPQLSISAVSISISAYCGLFFFSQTRALSTTRRLTDKRLDRSLGAGFSEPCHETWISSMTFQRGCGSTLVASSCTLFGNTL